jgi:hypothetical protein
MHNRIGLDLGGRTPVETALSIVAGIVGMKNGRSDVPSTRAGPVLPVWKGVPLSSSPSFRRDDPSFVLSGHWVVSLLGVSGLLLDHLKLKLPAERAKNAKAS